MLENLSSDEEKFHPEFRAHLELCPSCTHEWKAMLDLRQQFSNLEPVFPSLTSLRKLQEKARLTPVTLRGALNGYFVRWFKPILSPVLQWAPVLMIVFVVLTTCVVMFSTEPLSPNLATHAELNQPLVLHPKLIQPSLPVQQVAQSAAPSFLAELPNLSAMDTILPSSEPKIDLEKQYQLRVQSLLEADADELLMRGRRFKSMGRMDLALQDFETIYNFYPKYTYMGDVLMYRAQCYGFQGQVDKAVATLQEYAKLYPEKDALVTPMIEQLEAGRP